MKLIRIPAALALVLFVAACVTINVYFPAEAAEKAADRIIQDVYGEQPAASPAPTEPQSYVPLDQSPPVAVQLLNWLVTAAHANADISVNTPAIQQLKTSMEKRHKKLAPYYNSGAIGMTQNGELAMRDQKLVPMQKRNSLKSLLSKENKDRSALYKEIAKANGHPEWESEIRGTFAKRWVGNAPSGWWYQNKQGAWKQK
jgi:uncharacterized protein YdbL (DUF1318 family)